MYIPYPWASVGVQVKTPAEVIAAPAGAPGLSEYVSVFAGRSASVALAVNVSSLPSAIVLLPIGASTGSVRTSITDTVMDSESVSSPSDTWTSKV